MSSAHVIISGMVQGVGFREFVRSKANKLGIVGWVRNLPAGRQGTLDGKVEALFAGSQEKIEELIVLCKKGPMLSEVKDVWVEWLDKSEDLNDFKIVL